jgi:hypothetical protein
MKASGVDILTSSYTDDVEKLTSKMPDTVEDHLTDKEYTRPGLKFYSLLLLFLDCDVSHTKSRNNIQFKRSFAV